MGEEVEERSLTRKLRSILQEFQSPIVQEKLLEYRGTTLLYEAPNDWKDVEQMYSNFLCKLPFLKKLVSDHVVDLQDRLLTYLIHNSKSSWTILWIQQCQESTTNLGDITEGWLKLEKLCRECDVHLFELDDYLSPQLLAANFFHPHYHDHCFTSPTDDTDRLKKLMDFLLPLLEEKDLKGYTEYKNKIGIFRTLFDKKLKKWQLFWKIAMEYYPDLSFLVQKLLQVPVRVEKLNFVDFSADQLTPNRYKKFVDVHHHLRLQKITEADDNK